MSSLSPVVSFTTVTTIVSATVGSSFKSLSVTVTVKSSPGTDSSVISTTPVTPPVSVTVNVALLTSSTHTLSSCVITKKNSVPVKPVISAIESSIVSSPLKLVSVPSIKVPPVLGSPIYHS